MKVPPIKWTYGETTVSFGEDAVRSDADGRYRTTKGVPRDETYAVIVGAPGMLSWESKYVTPPKDGKSFRWPDAVLRRQRSVSGIVVDHEGKPVRGATVSSPAVEMGRRAMAQTDEGGKFTLTSVHPDSRLVFVQKEGYRASGDKIRSGPDWRLTLEAESAPPTAPLRSIRRPLQHRSKLLKDLLTPLLAQSDDEFNVVFVVEALTRIAPIDRTFVLKHLDRVPDNARRVDVLVALGLLDDALEQAALGKDADHRAFWHLAIADAASDVARKRQNIAEALVAARAIVAPDHRVYRLADVARHLLKLGDRAAAQKILDEGKAAAANLALSDWSGFARGHFAESLAPLDPDGALELIKGLKGDDLARHAGNIAHHLAGLRPADAERALKLIKEDRILTQFAVRVCYRMASVDLPRARRLADSIASMDDPTMKIGQQAQAYGAMAMALAKKNPTAARALLHQAFQKLDSPEKHTWVEWRTFGELAALLVGYSETVDPARTREYFWRTLTMHPGPAVQPWGQDRNQQAHNENISQLVLLLALYGQYPELQKELMDPVFRYWSNFTNGANYNLYRENSTFTAMALADPERTIAWHAAFYRKVGNQERRSIPQPWMTIADAFKSDGRALHEHIAGEVYHYWIIDKEDL
jgi:hypothetical protein